MHSAILTHVYTLQGAVYGGYVRDTIAGVQPKDIDVVVPAAHWAQFVNALTFIGYRNIPNPTTSDAVLFVKDGELSIEAISGEDAPGSVLIGPPASPDFDVNLLAYNGRLMYNWGPIGKDLGVLDIISRISKREALQFREASPERVAKMISKGYRIVKVIDA
jgi:hypothetical protein